MLNQTQNKFSKRNLRNKILTGVLVILFTISLLNLAGLVNLPVAKSADSTLIMKRAFFETNNHPTSVITENSDLYLNHQQVGFKIPNIESTKPSETTLLYRNVRAVNNYDPEFQTFLNNNWILRDPNGNLIRSTVSPSQYIVDKGSVTYQQWVANWINSYVYTYDYDGVFLDPVKF